MITSEFGGENMPQLGLHVMDRTIQDTNTWLSRISEEMNHPDRQMAYHALRGVLHALRDRLTVEEAHHFGAQLPTLVRGFYFEGYRPADKPLRYRDREPFIQTVSAELQQSGGENPEDATRAVFAVITRELDAGIVSQVRDMLPEAVRQLWQEPVE
ncbi:MAG: DUF2267 domain-containing protein [Bacteroidota bacterium]